MRPAVCERLLHCVFRGLGIIHLAALQAAASPLLPEGPGPATNRFAQLVTPPTLTWVGGGANLLVNGDFETGDLTGWNREGAEGKSLRVVMRPAGAPSFPNNFAGTYGAEFGAGLPGPNSLFQLVTLPAEATGAVLSWADRLDMDAAGFAPGQTFRVEVQTPDGFPLAVVSQRVTGDSGRPPWVRRSVNLGQFAGQTIRVAFIESDKIGPLTVYLDEVRLETTAPPGTTFDVFLSAGTPPTPADRLGEATVPSLRLPPLAPKSTYFWQVVAKEGGEIRSGPIWSFTTGDSGPISEFTWDLAEGSLHAGQPIASQLQARDSAGFVVPAFTGIAQLGQLATDERPPSLLISEVYPTSGVEFLNGSDQRLELAGWEVSFYDSTVWPKPRTTFVFPTDSGVDAGKILQLRRGGTAPGGGAVFFTGQPINWTFNKANRVVAVLLRDSRGAIVDFFAADEAFAAAISEPIAVPLTEWIGRPAPRLSTGESYQRLGSRDLQLGTDWIPCFESFGRLNPYGGPRFQNGVAVHELSPALAGPFVTGKWIGDIEPARAGNNVLFLADDRQGQVGWTRRLEVQSSPVIALELPRSLAEGSQGTAIVRLPVALATNLLVSLESGWPARLPLPASLTIPAGALEATLPLVVVDDSRLQGPQIITLRLSAQGFARIATNLAILDDETTTITLELPAQLVEDGPTGTAVLNVAQAPEVPVQLKLSASPAGQVLFPEFIELPAGQTQVTFPLSAVNDLFIDGNVAVEVTARADNWTPGTDTAIAMDNDDRQIRLVVPPQVRGQSATTNGQVSLSGRLAEDLVIQLELSPANVLQAPATVRIPAGATSAEFELGLVPGQPFRGTTLVSVTAAAPGFSSTNIFCEVWDETKRELNLAVTDLVLHPGWDRLLAVVAARDGVHPNELVVVNPYTGEIERTLPVATDPTSVALTDDGQFLWIGSYGESLVQRIDLEAFAITGSFSLEDHWPVQLIARRGRNDSVVVYRYKTNAGNEVALYTDGVRQPDVVNPGQLLFMSPTRGDADQVFVSIPSTISGVGAPMNEYRVTDAGLTWQRTGPEDPPSVWEWADGRLYSSKGRIRDAATFAALPGIAGLDHQMFSIEPARDRGFFLTIYDGLLHLTRASLSLGTIAPPVTFPQADSSLGVTRPVRWGEHGLAFRASDTLYLFESAYIDPGPPADLQVLGSVLTNLRVNEEFDWALTVTNAGPAAASGIRLEGALPPSLLFVRATVPGGDGSSVSGGWNASLPPLAAGASATVRLTLRPTLAGPASLSVLASLLQRDPQSSNNTVTAAPTIRLDLGPDQRQAIDLAAADLCFDPRRNTLWATVPDFSVDGTHDRLVRIDPDTGLITGEFPAGRFPGRLMCSDDGTALWVALDGESQIRRFDLLTETWGTQLALFDHPVNDSPARNLVTDLVVLPGLPERVVAVWSLPENEFSSIRYYRTVAFSEGVRLPDEAALGPEIERSTTPGEVVTFTGGFLSRYTISRHAVGATGLTTLDSKDGLLGGLDIRVEGNLLYSSSGQVLELPSLAPVRDYGFLASGLILPLPALNRLVYLDNDGFATDALLSMKLLEEGSGRLVEEIDFVGEAMAAPLLFCGGDRIAMRAYENSNVPTRVVILRTSAIPSGTASTDLQAQLSLTTPIAPSGQTAEFRLTVTNAGPGIAERVHYRVNWVGGARSVQASRGIVTQDYYEGVRGFVEQLAAGESVELVFMAVPADMGRFPVTANAYCAGPDSNPSNDGERRFQSFSMVPLLNQNVPLYQANIALVSDPAGRRLFLSAPDGVVEVDPVRGALLPDSRFGPAPGALAVSADGASLWVAHNRQRTLTRYRLSDGLMLQQVTGLPGNNPVASLVAHPVEQGLAAFVLGHQIFWVDATGAGELYAPVDSLYFRSLAFAPDGSLLVSRTVLDGSPSSHPLERIGTTGAQRGQVLATGSDATPTSTLRVHAGRAYLDQGVIVNAVTLQRIPISSGPPPGSPAILASAGRVAYLEAFNGNRIRLTAEDLSPVGGVRIVAGVGNFTEPSSLTPWGADGLAFRSDQGLALFRLGPLPVAADRDFDGDGIPDLWEWENDLNPGLDTDADDDLDGDGANARDEYVAGTRIREVGSVLKLRDLSLIGDKLRVRFDGVGGRRYQLEGARRLGEGWAPVGASVTGQDASLALEFEPTAGWESGVYRLRVSRD